MDFFYSINLCSCTYMRVLSSLYILNIASFVKGRALIKTCPSCIHTSCLVFFIFIWLGVFFLSVKPFAIKLHQRDVNCFLNIFLFCFCFSLNTFQTHAAFNSFINLEGNRSLKKKKKKNPKLPLQFYNHNFMVLKFSKTEYTNQSTKKKKSLKQNSSESWVVVVVEFGQDFDQFLKHRTYVYIDHSVELKILEIITYLFFIKTQGNVSDCPYETSTEIFKLFLNYLYT